MEAYRDQYASIFNDGDGVTLLAISTDDPEELQSWAADSEFPFQFASDPGAEVGRAYGAFRRLSDGRYQDNRTVFVIDAEGIIRYVAAPFREIDPTAYEELAAAIDAVSAGEVPPGATSQPSASEAD